MKRFNNTIKKFNPVSKIAKKTTNQFKWQNNKPKKIEYNFNMRNFCPRKDDTSANKFQKYPYTFMTIGDIVKKKENQPEILRNILQSPEKDNESKDRDLLLPEGAQTKKSMSEFLPRDKEGRKGWSTFKEVRPATEQEQRWGTDDFEEAKKLSKRKFFKKPEEEDSEKYRGMNSYVLGLKRKLSKDNQSKDYIYECPRCGYEITDKQKVCPQCRLDLNKSSEEYEEEINKLINAGK